MPVETRWPPSVGFCSDWITKGIFPWDHLRVFLQVMEESAVNLLALLKQDNQVHMDSRGLSKQEALESLLKPPPLLTSPRRSKSFVDRVVGRGDSIFFSRDAGISTRIVYHTLLMIVLLFSIVSFIASWLLLLDPDGCDQTNDPTRGRDHLNPDYKYDPCWHHHRLVLLGMSPWEADMNVRVVMSLATGSLIGFERRRADRAAGIRTMALVCLGSCVFTIGSQFAFIGGPMAWDSSRVSAAIPSGVGFLGAASIWKGTRVSQDNDSKDTTTVPEVHGLTTATSVWLSSAVGILVGGNLYGPAIFSTAVSVVYLRFAPRLRTKNSAAESGPPAEEGASASVRPTGTNPPMGVIDIESLRPPATPDRAAAGALPMSPTPASSQAGARKEIRAISSEAELRM